MFSAEAEGSLRRRSTATLESDLSGAAARHAEEIEMDEFQHPPAEDEPLPKQFSRQDLVEYFWTEGNWRFLAGTSLCWFLLDFAFYGLGMNNPRLLARLWRQEWTDPVWRPGNSVRGNAPNYVGPSGPFIEASAEERQAVTLLREDLFDNARRSALTVFIESILGTLFLYFIIDHMNRKRALIYSFFLLGALFIVTAICCFLASGTDYWFVTVVFYSLCQFFFNLGKWWSLFSVPFHTTYAEMNL